MPEDKEQFALPMNGKKMNIRKKDFLIFADECGIPHASAEKMIVSLVAMLPKFIAMCDESRLPEKLKERLKNLMTERCKILD
mgnify:FL=1